MLLTVIFITVQQYKIVANYSTSLHLWLNYFMFEALAGKKRFVENAFRCALTVLLDRDDRIRVWFEYVYVLSLLMRVVLECYAEIMFLWYGACALVHVFCLCVCACM